VTRLFNRSLWTAARLLAALPPLLLLIFAIFLLRREFQHSRPEIIRLVTAEISAATGIEITFSSADASMPGRLKVEDIALSRKGFGEIARARSVTVRYDLGELLRDPQNASAHVTSVFVDRPEITVERRRDGTISLVEAFRPKKPRPKSKPFRGIVRVADGRVRYIDRRPPSGTTAPLEIYGRGVDGTLDFRSGNGAYCTATIRRTDVSGRVRLQVAFDYRKRASLSVRTERLSLPFVSRFLLPRGIPPVQAGVADGSLLLTHQESGTHLWVSGRVQQGEITLPGGLSRISSIAGTVTVADTDLLTFDGSGQAAGSLWSVKGTVGPLGRPQVAVEVASSRADYAAMLRLLPRASLPEGVGVRGRGPVRVRVTGPAADLSIEGEARIPEAVWRGNRARDIRSSFRLAKGTLSLRAGGEVEGGRAEVRLSADVSGGQKGELHTVFQGVHVARLLEAAGYRDVRGAASGEAALRWSGASTEGRLTLDVDRPRAFGLEATSLRASGRLSGKRLLLDSLLISTRSGFVSATGSIGLDGRADLSAVAVGMPVQELLGPYTPPGSGGILDARGRIFGPLTDPTFEGALQGMDLRWEGLELDGALARLTANRNVVDIQEARVYHGTSEIALRGRIRNPLQASRSFDLSATIRSLELGQVAAYVPALEGMEGRVSGEVSAITGSWPDLRAAFEVRAEDLDVAGLTVPLATARGAYDAGRLELAEFKAQRGTAAATASGTLEETGQLDFAFRLEDLDVAEALAMAAQRGIPAAGRVDIEGRLEGTISAPEVHARLSSRDLQLAAREVELDDCDLVWADGQLSLRDGSARVAGGRILIERVIVSTESGDGGLSELVVRLGADGSGEQPVDAAELLAIARGIALSLGVEGAPRQILLQLPERVQGRLTGEIRISRENGSYSGQAELTSPRISVWGAELGRAELSASAGPEGYAVHSLKLEDGEMLVVGNGSLDTGGRLKADLEGYNVDLKRIPQALEVSSAPGSADFSFTASGTLESPEVEGSVLISDAEFAGLKLERIATGRMLFREDSVEVREGSIATGQNVVRISGSAPYSIRELAFRDGGPVSLQARLVNPDMDLLSLVIPRLDVERSSGDVEAGITVEGTWPVPQLRGQVRVADGQLAITGMSTLFRNVRVDLDLQGTRVAIREFRMDSSDGGTLVVEGGAGLEPEGWQVDASAKARGLGLKLRNVSGVYDESYSGKVDVDLRMAGPVRSPLISGEVTARNGTVGLPVIPEEREERRKPVWNPRLSLALRAGEGLRVRGPRLNAGVEGNVAVSRDLENPSVAGRLVVRSGYLLFPGSRFRVVPPGTIDFSWDSPNPPAVTLDIRAETTLASAVGVGPGGPSYRIEAALRGSLQEPQLTFQSSPPGLETQQIMNLLAQRAGVGPGGFSGGAQLQREMAQLFTASVAPGMLQPVEEALADVFGLEELAFGFGGPEMLNLSLTRRLFGGLSLTIWRGLGEAAEWSEWKLTYDLKGRTRVSYGESRFGDRILGLESTFRF
jgi:autotransporter translocation and assembly factor TamB